MARAPGGGGRQGSGRAGELAQGPPRAAPGPFQPFDSRSIWVNFLACGGIAQGFRLQDKRRRRARSVSNGRPGVR